MLIVMAGLPGTGKSTIAARLAEAFGGAVVDKDRVRSTLFPPPLLDYSAAQDDLTVRAIYAAAGHVLTGSPDRVIILDGRTYSKRSHLTDLRGFARSVGQEPRLIECVAADEVVRRRLEADRQTGHHPAGNRSFDLYQTVKARAEPIEGPRLVLDTGSEDLGACVRRALDYLSKPAHAGSTRISPPPSDPA